MALGLHHIRDGTHQLNLYKTVSMVRKLLHLLEKGPGRLWRLWVNQGCCGSLPNSSLTHCFPSNPREESLGSIFGGQYPARDAAVDNDLWYCSAPPHYCGTLDILPEKGVHKWCWRAQSISSPFPPLEERGPPQRCREKVITKARGDRGPGLDHDATTAGVMVTQQS